MKEYYLTDETGTYFYPHMFGKGTILAIEHSDKPLPFYNEDQAIKASHVLNDRGITHVIDTNTEVKYYVKGDFSGEYYSLNMCINGKRLHFMSSENLAKASSFDTREEALVLWQALQNGGCEVSVVQIVDDEEQTHD